MNYRLLASAIDDIAHIESWVASNFGEAAAIRSAQKLSEVFLLLARYPQMGIERPDITSRPVRFFALPQNWIVYEPGDPLLIHRVFPAILDIEILSL